MISMHKPKSKLEKYARCLNQHRYLLFFVCLAFYQESFLSKVDAQDVTATLKADSNHIVIGDFLRVKLSVKFPKEFTVLMPSAVDSVGNMEVVKNSKIDTVISGNFKTLSQTYTLSAYDSGKYHAGPQKIIFTNKSGISDSIFTDSVLVAVTTLPVDTTRAFKPIKKPVDIPYTLSEFLPYIIG